MSLETRLTNWNSKTALFVKVLNKVERFASCISRVIKGTGIIESYYFVVFLRLRESNTGENLAKELKKRSPLNPGLKHKQII